MAETNKATGNCGESWRDKEMLDLLSFWGQEKTQEALGTFHRNTDKHERIARWMVSRRHKHSVVECYTKIVLLQQDYKRVVAYNNQSGNPSAAYPFYKELHCILREEASIKPKTMPRSLNLQVVKEVQRLCLDGIRGLEELLGHDLVTINCKAYGVLHL